MHEIPKEVAHQMFAAYTTLGGMFLLGLLLMIVFPVGMNGCGGKLLIPWFVVVTPLLTWQEAKDFDALALQPHWHLVPGLWLGLRKMCEFALMLSVNIAIFLGWGTLLDKVYKTLENRAKKPSPS